MKKLRQWETWARQEKWEPAIRFRVYVFSRSEFLRKILAILGPEIPENFLW
jgi:hypothetical protein